MCTGAYRACQDYYVRTAEAIISHQDVSMCMGKTELPYLGDIVSKNSIKVYAMKIQAVADWHEPSNLDDIVHLWRNSPGICSWLAVQQGSYLQDSLLLYCRREQERREERQRIRSEAGGILDPMEDEGSFDDGDPYTTNLYIGAHHNQTPLVCCSSTQNSVLQTQMMHVSYSIKLCKPKMSLAQLC